MGLLGDFVNGFVTGAASAAADSLRNGVHGGSSSLMPIQRLCQQLGWGIDEFLPSGIILHFKDPILSIRKLLITVGDSGAIAVVSSFSAAQIPTRRVTSELLAFALHRNSEITLPAWQMCVDGNNVTFAAAHCVLVGGLDPHIFKYVCETTVKEVSAFDAKLQGAGLL